MLIITSVGRCGTSIFTKYLHSLGLDVGRTRWIDHLDAGMECQQTGNINSVILRDSVVIDSTKDKIRSIKNDVAKDPQFLVSPKVLETWVGVRDDIEVLLLRRDPVKIVESLKRHPFMNTPVFRNHIDLIIKHEKLFTETVDRLGVPMSTLYYPDFINQFEDIYEYVTERFAINQSKNAAKVKFHALIDPNKVHV